MTAIENRVRSVFAAELRVSPDHFRAETLIRHGDFSRKALNRIAREIARQLELWPIGADNWTQDTWTSVADAIEWAEARQVAKQQRAA